MIKRREGEVSDNPILRRCVRRTFFEVAHQLDRHGRAARYRENARRDRETSNFALLHASTRPVHRRHANQCVMRSTDIAASSASGQARQQHERAAEVRYASICAVCAVAWNSGSVMAVAGARYHHATLRTTPGAHAVDDHIQMRQLRTFRLSRRADVYRMMAVSSGAVATVSNVAGCVPRNRESGILLSRPAARIHGNRRMR